jgi:VanZ family protein
MKQNPWIPVIFVSLLILILTSVPKIPAPPRSIHFLDKVAHFLIYFLWGFTLSRIWNARFSKSAAFTAFMCATPVLFPAFDELHQFLIPGRNPSLLDWVCDVAGAALGFSIFAKWKQHSGNGA